jgi:ATP-dependent phosphofructokinase / diphosphate-dependent phosphofructokinase
MKKTIGILTAGSDCPGLNAAIRAIGKTAHNMDMEVLGFKDGFEGLLKDQIFDLGGETLSGILTSGGTLLGTSRAQPHAIQEGHQVLDMTAKAVETYRRYQLDALVCIGGRETQESAFHLMQQGLNLITIPKAVDNDIAETDTAIGFDTALETAAEAIDRLHTTANSTHRIIIVEMMGRHSGWLTLGAGLAGGADVIMIPEIPYDAAHVIDSLLERDRAGKRFSIVAVAEGAVPKEYVEFYERSRQTNQLLRSGEDRERVASQLTRLEENRASDNTSLLASRLEKATNISSRITILGYLLRGGVPSAADRVLATELGITAVEWVQQGKFGVMAAMLGGKIVPVPLEKLQGRHKTVPMDDLWIASAKRVGVSLGV